MNLLLKNQRSKTVVFFLILILVSCFFVFDVSASDCNIYITIIRPSDQMVYEDVRIPNNKFKSFMSYESLTKKESKQYMLQQMCNTDELGLRNYFGRYVIAVGSGVGGEVGDLVDILLENGTIIPCVIGDYKSDVHTDKNNLTGLDGSSTEFIVDTKTLYPIARKMGDTSYCHDDWNSPVITIRKYKINIFGGNYENKQN